MEWSPLIITALTSDDYNSIFPTGQNPQQTVTITSGDLFGAHLATGTNANDALPLSLNPLRCLAQDGLALMGLIPA